jgi:hypothetical protein
VYRARALRLRGVGAWLLSLLLLMMTMLQLREQQR